ncbi:hypothetical protein ACQEV4_15615 [Streptomyces shenzhenensis]
MSTTAAADSCVVETENVKRVTAHALVIATFGLTAVQHILSTAA